MDHPEVDELIEYCCELEGKVVERNINDTYDKEHMLKTMLSDILTSCKEYEENKILQDRYPKLYQKIDADDFEFDKKINENFFNRKEISERSQKFNENIFVNKFSEFVLEKWIQFIRKK